MSNNEIKKKERKKGCRLALTFQNRDLDHWTRSTIHRKSHEIQSQANQTLKDEIIEEKNQLHQMI
jgi:hypothetical protein